MVAKRIFLAPVAALALVAPGVAAASPKAGGPLAPLRENDVSAFVKELPGENIGDGGGFSVGRNRYVRLEGRHLTFRTASGVKKCVIAAAEAKAWTFDNIGTVGCGGIRLTMNVDNRAKSDIGQPIVLTVSQAGRVSKMNGLWQGLD